MSCCQANANGVPPSDLVHTMINVGGFAETYRNGTGPQPFELRTWQSSDGSVQIVQNVNDLALTVTPGGAGGDVFQVDSTATRLSNTSTPTTFVTLAGTSKMLDGETWKINMCVLICVPPSVGVNAQQLWQIETSTGVFTEFDRYSERNPLSISGGQQSEPFHRTKLLVASMDAPRMRLQVHRVSAGSTNYFWELPRWGGAQISEAP